MTTQTQLRKGTAAEHAVFTGEMAEITVVTDTSPVQLRLHDGVTPGGVSVGGSKEIVAVPESDLSVDGVLITLQAGEALAFGDVCRIASDGKVIKANATTISTMPVALVATESMAADNSGLFLIQGIVRNDAWTFTPGGRVYAGITAGTMTQTAPSGSGQVVQVLGIATHATRILFNPSMDTLELA